jgi:parallel beta-helix repeat protein
MKRILLPCLLMLVLLTAICLFPLPPAESLGSGPKVYIHADGSIQGTSSIQRNGDTYTLTGDVAGSLIIEKDNVVIDGAGHTVTGASGRGIDLSHRHGVTVKNTKVTLEGGYTINLEAAEDCMLIGNTLTGTASLMLGPLAINFLHSQRITVKDNTITNFSEALSLRASSGHTITGNTLTDGFSGISIENTTGCVFRNNNLRNCGFSVATSFYGSGLDNDLDISNTVDGKPVYYWVNVKDQTVPSDAAYVALVNCANIIVKDIAPQGICIVSTRDSTVSNVCLGRVTEKSRGDGITILDSSGISLLDSTVVDKGIGVTIENSSNTLVSGNEISKHITKGINLVNAVGTVISGNNFADNSHAIGCTPYSLSTGTATSTTVAYNNFTGNDCAVNVCGDMKIHNNLFDRNEIGIMFSDYSANTVTQNILVNNKNALYFSASSGNIIYQNNFLENERQVADAGVSSTLAQPAKAAPSNASIQLLVSHVEGVNFFPPPPPSHNQYDNGTHGNYWIDYRGSDGNRDGIGDTAYILYEDNQDNHPLMNPVDISMAAPAHPPQSNPPDTNPPQENTGTGGLALSVLPTEIIVVLVTAAIAVSVCLVVVYFKKRRSMSAMGIAV